MRCTRMEDKLIEYLDGRAKPAERHAIEEHLSSCADCRIRAEEFRALSGVLDDLPLVSPSPVFDATLRARIAAEPQRRPIWNWLPSPRLVIAVTALIVMSVWLASMPAPRGTASQAKTDAPATQMTADSEFSMIRDLPVLENYDVLSKFDALTELPTPQSSATGEQGKESR
jgi:anti-sigma factor RsiW